MICYSTRFRHMQGVKEVDENQFMPRSPSDSWRPFELCCDIATGKHSVTSFLISFNVALWASFSHISEIATVIPVMNNDKISPTAFNGILNGQEMVEIHSLIHVAM
jgi:hypothetical protein